MDTWIAYGDRGHVSQVYNLVLFSFAERGIRWGLRGEVYSRRLLRAKDIWYIVPNPESWPQTTRLYVHRQVINISNILCPQVVTKPT